MGVTIHFEGQLKDQVAFQDLMELAKAFARSRGWEIEPIDLQETTLARVRDEKDWDYVGPVSGVALYPGPNCEPMRLEFDRDLYIQEYTKTQFAGLGIHLSIVELLREIEPFFQRLSVEDEGEYWETGDAETLARHFSRCQEVIEEELRKSPAGRMNVKTPSGRIIDLIV